MENKWNKISDWCFTFEIALTIEAFENPDSLGGGLIHFMACPIELNDSPLDVGWYANEDYGWVDQFRIMLKSHNPPLDAPSYESCSEAIDCISIEDMNKLIDAGLVRSCMTEVGCDEDFSEENIQKINDIIAKLHPHKLISSKYGGASEVANGDYGDIKL